MVNSRLVGQRFNRKQVESAIELARIRAADQAATVKLLILLADQLEAMLSLFDRSAHNAKLQASRERERELSKVLGILEIGVVNTAELEDTGELVIGEPTK